MCQSLGQSYFLSECHPRSVGPAFVGACCSGGPAGGVRRVECVRFRIGGDGYESPIAEDDEDADAGAAGEDADDWKLIEVRA